MPPTAAGKGWQKQQGWQKQGWQKREGGPKGQGVKKGGQQQPHQQQQGLPSVRKQMRGLERLLKKGNLPDHVREEKEAALRQLGEKAKTNKRVERERHFSKKYHKVKFFERLKVEKRLGQLRKQLAEAPEAERAALEAQVQESEHDLLYVQHFPRHKKYLSIFPSADGDNEYVAKQRARIRSMLVRRAAEGTLEPRPSGAAASSAQADGADGGDDDDDEAEGESEEEGGGGGLEEDAFFAAAEEAVADDSGVGDDDDDDDDDDDADDDDDEEEEEEPKPPSKKAPAAEVKRKREPERTQHRQTAGAKASKRRR